MVLALHLNRFSEDGMKSGKSVKFEETLDIGKHVAESEHKNLKSNYQLFAIIVHQGASRHSGNYVAYSMREPEPIAAVQEEEEETDEEVQIVQEVDEDQERLQSALQAAATKPKVDNNEAIIVQHNETMESKRSKLDRLIEQETAHGRSAQAKEALLAKSGDSQFFENVGRWDEDLGDVVEDKRKAALKQVKSKRKKVDMYDLDYDRGKVKKIKNKQMDKFGKPNMFQIASDAKKKK
ncbi:hypothetical protein DFQ28_006558 [Apophysomyces sp. BC1034]|nr:hypothetical protein DFQ28_006558 [Apophysomyces sp. BC1034]